MYLFILVFTDLEVERSRGIFERSSDNEEEDRSRLARGDPVFETKFGTQASRIGEEPLSISCLGGKQIRIEI